MLSPQPTPGPACGNCGAHFSPGQEVCAACGAHRYSAAAPMVGPLARPTPALQRSFWWALAGVSTIVCGILAVVFGLLDALRHLLPH